MPSGQLFAVQGSDHNLSLTAKNSAGDVIDISGATEIDWRLYTTANQDTDPLLQKLMSTGSIILSNGGSDGKFDVPISDTDTPTIDPSDSYEWQARISVPGRERVCLTGPFTLYAAGDFTS